MIVGLHFLVPVLAQALALMQAAALYAAEPGLSEALIQAVRSGNEAKAEQLLAAGAPADSRDRSGWTPLHWSCFLGHVRIADLLLGRAADANARSAAGTTPLMEAAREGRGDIVDLLLKRREIIRAGISTSLADVMAEARGTPVEVVKPQRGKVILLDARDTHGNTALILAAAQGRVRVVEILLAAGADVRTMNRAGKTAQSVAEERKHERIAEMIAEAARKKH
jgi:ankyrin repeat protein